VCGHGGIGALGQGTAAGFEPLEGFAEFVRVVPGHVYCGTFE